MWKSKLMSWTTFRQMSDVNWSSSKTMKATKFLEKFGCGTKIIRETNDRQQ